MTTEKHPGVSSSEQPAHTGAGALTSDVVADPLTGVAWPAVQPGEDPVLYGHARLEHSDPVPVRSFQSFNLVYTVGRFGIDDTGGIRVVFRVMSDFGVLQTHDPSAMNYVSAETGSGGRLSLDYKPYTGQRPFNKALTVVLHGGYLREGDTITIRFGDRRGGCPGMQMPTFVDSGFEFRVLADVCATGHYYPLRETPSVAVVPGDPLTWKAVLPSLRRTGEVFRLGLKIEDLWGNPTDLAHAELKLNPSMPVANLPETVSYMRGQRSLILDDLHVEEAGILRITVADAAGRELAEAGPLIIRPDGVSGYWGDLHGQSGESIGVTTSRQYFEFARDLAFLDVTGHQANDFQVNNAFWAYLNELTAHYHQDQRFVVFPGYEWSGNTAVGGDRNVFFRHEGRQIHRSSHALLPDRSDIDTDAQNARLLFEALQQEDCVCYAHVGGRYADIHYAHDPRLETAMEIHSAWGTFEWMLTDGFPLGHRSGVVCNSDGHKGRPGASYPGTAMFGAYGGLTCFLTDDLSRDGIFECLRRRHHYGTTGCRMHMDVSVSFDSPALLYERDPDVYDNPATREVSSVTMGDIVRSRQDSAILSLVINAHSPIERIEIRNGTTVVETWRPYSAGDLGQRIRVLWGGAEYRGRGRQSAWRGSAVFRQAEITRFQKINAFNHERRLAQSDKSTVVWDAMTTGNFGGFDVWLNESSDASLSVQTNNGALALPLSDVGIDEHVLDAGGLEKKLRVFRLPELNPWRDVEHQVRIPLSTTADNPLWICVTLEDGFQAWSSPVFVFS